MYKKIRSQEGSAKVIVTKNIVLIDFIIDAPVENNPC